MTGNLAVTNAASGAGYVAIFPNAKGPPEDYYDSEIGAFGLCAYDSGGNLFVDGPGAAICLRSCPRAAAVSSISA